MATRRENENNLIDTPIPHCPAGPDCDLCWYEARTGRLDPVGVCVWNGGDWEAYEGDPGSPTGYRFAGTFTHLADAAIAAGEEVER